MEEGGWRASHWADHGDQDLGEILFLAEFAPGSVLGTVGQEQKVLEACPSHPSPARTMLSSSISFILEFRKLLIIFILLIT